LTSDSFTSYAQSDVDVLANAQDRVAAQRQPAYRLDSVAVGMWNTTTDRYAAVAGTEIGDRIRLTTVPAKITPATQMDFLAEGWSDVYAIDGYTVTFDTSPADSPPRAVWDNTTYGRWQCDGQTLNGAITASAVSISVATAAGKPTFTTVSARYPLQIQIGAEVMTVTAAPAGSSSPQTLTVTRGQSGATAAAQANGADVQLYPAAAWTI